MKLTIVKQNAELVILRCTFDPKDPQLDAACHPGFTGEETLISITRGMDHNYTIFYQNSKPCQFSYSQTRSPLISSNLEQFRLTIINRLASHGININEKTDQIRNTLKFMYFPHDNPLQRHSTHLGSQYIWSYKREELTKNFPNLKHQRQEIARTGAIVEHYTFDPRPLVDSNI